MDLTNCSNIALYAHCPFLDSHFDIWLASHPQQLAEKKQTQSHQLLFVSHFAPFHLHLLMHNISKMIITVAISALLSCRHGTSFNQSAIHKPVLYIFSFCFGGIERNAAARECRRRQSTKYSIQKMGLCLLCSASLECQIETVIRKKRRLNLYIHDLWEDINCFV